MWLSQNKGVVSAKYILLRLMHPFMVQALKLVGGFAPLKIPGSSSSTQREVLLYPLPAHGLKIESSISFCFFCLYI